MESGVLHIFPFLQKTDGEEEVAGSDQGKGRCRDWSAGMKTRAALLLHAEEF